MSRQEESFVVYRTPKLIPVPPDANRDSSIIKLAVNLDAELWPKFVKDNRVEKKTQFVKFDQKRPLAAIIEELGSFWEIENSSDFGLKLTEPATSAWFITEKNRNELRNGAILTFTYSTTKTSADLLQQLPSADYSVKTSALQKLAALCDDPTFAQEFIAQKGLSFVISMIEEGKCTDPALTSLLISFTELMEHGQTSWEVLSEKFVTELSNYVVGKTKTENAKTLTIALSILESIVSNSSKNLPVAEREIAVESLIRHLSNSDSNVQTNALALINALFIKAAPEKQTAIVELMTCKPVRETLGNSVFRNAVGVDLAHQLATLQTLLLKTLEIPLMTPAKAETDVEKLQQYRRLAFEPFPLPTTPHSASGAGGEPLSPSILRRQQAATASGASSMQGFAKLGFTNSSKPLEDFQLCPPGTLALDCLLYFARTHQDSFRKIVIEMSVRVDERVIPFTRLAVQLCKVLAELLKIGQMPGEEATLFYEFLLKHERGFMEIFAVSAELLMKTWREMHATTIDVDKVMSVVREQLSRALAKRPATFRDFQEELNKCPYSEIQKQWNIERSQKEQSEFQAKPILQLREQLRPAMIELIRQNRLNFLKEGHLFAKYGKGQRGSRDKGRFWFWKLSNNLKTFLFDDCDEKRQMDAMDHLKQKLQVSDIRQLVTGRECPHMKDAKGKLVKANFSLAFSLLLDDPEVGFNFMAADEEIFDLWTDGLNALLGKEMTSKKMKEDLEILLNMEIQIQLLDLEGIEIPDEAPPLPAPPSNYDFCYEYR